MSFPEIILTYARNPPLAVVEHLKMGRRPRKRSELTYDILVVIEREAQRQGSALKDVREEYVRMLGKTVDNISRPLTVDELVGLCERLSLNAWDILTKAVENASVRDRMKE